MNRSVGTVLTILTTSLLLGCSPGVTPNSDPGSPASSPQGSSSCIEGAWNLDVEDYSFQSEDYVRGLGLPITDFAMAGSGVIRFTAEGLVATDIDLVTTGTIVAGDTRVPLNTQSSYHGSGDWGPGDDPDSIDLDNWANLPNDGVAADPAAPPIPAIDYTNIDAVMALCTEDTLILQAFGAPLYAKWHR